MKELKNFKRRASSYNNDYKNSLLRDFRTENILLINLKLNLYKRRIYNNFNESAYFTILKEYEKRIEVNNQKIEILEK